MLQRPALTQHNTGPGDHDGQSIVPVQVHQARFGCGLGPCVQVAGGHVAKTGGFGDLHCWVGHVIGRDCAGINQSLDPSRHRRLRNAQGCAHFGGKGGIPTGFHRFGQIEHDVNARHRSLKCCRISQVHRDGFHMIGDVVKRAGPAPADHAHIMARGNQRPGQRPPDETRPADDHNLGRGGEIGDDRGRAGGQKRQRVINRLHHAQR